MDMPDISYYEEASGAVERQLLNKQFERLRELREDWDGYGAAQPSAYSLSNAAAVAESALARGHFATLPEVSPNPNGTVSLEWEYDGNEAYLEIGNSRVAGYLKMRGSSAIYLQGSAVDATVLLPALLTLI